MPQVQAVAARVRQSAAAKLGDPKFRRWRLRASLLLRRNWALGAAGSVKTATLGNRAKIRNRRRRPRACGINLYFWVAWEATGRRKLFREFCAQYHESTLLRHPSFQGGGSGYWRTSADEYVWERFKLSGTRFRGVELRGFCAWEGQGNRGGGSGVTAAVVDVGVGLGGCSWAAGWLVELTVLLPYTTPVWFTSNLRVRLDIKCTRRENVCQSMDMTVRFGICVVGLGFVFNQFTVMPVPLCNLQFNGYGSPLVLHRLYTFEPLRPLERKFLAILFTRLENVCLSVELLILAFSSTQDLYKNRFISVITDASRNGGGGRVWVGWVHGACKFDARGACAGILPRREREIGTRRRHEGRIELAAPNRCCAGLSTGEGMAVAASLGVVRRTVGSVGNAEKSGGWRVEGCGDRRRAAVAKRRRSEAM
ncbi:hypothetical protein R3P38DRAFT_2792193 [Favolaschia claudopus]|uniref:Uncharacterized protein n=1 Tax=Favolaschia claudopus TaxID=2862362 RepID=A0AAW0AHE5_9AGAR